MGQCLVLFGRASLPCRRGTVKSGYDPNKTGRAAVERSSRSAAVLAREDAALADVMKIRFYPFVAAAAEGVRMWDLDGKEYLDLIGSAGVAQTGYGHPRVRHAIVDELDRHTTGMQCCHATERGRSGRASLRARVRRVREEGLVRRDRLGRERLRLEAPADGDGAAPVDHVRRRLPRDRRAARRLSPATRPRQP